MVNSEEIADGFEPKPVSRSYSGDSSHDRSLSDLNHAAEDLSDKLKNVGLNEVTKEQSEKMMSVSESNGGLDSNAVVTINQEEEEEEEDRDGYGYGDGWSENESENVYPVRPGAEDCSFYMRTGSCKFGSSCKFNHPLARKFQVNFTFLYGFRWLIRILVLNCVFFIDLREDLFIKETIFKSVAHAFR